MQSPAQRLTNEARQAEIVAVALRCVFFAHLMTGYRHLLLRLLESCVQSGDSPQKLDTSAAATLLVGVVQGLVMKSMLSGQISCMRKHASPVFNLYLHGINKKS